MDMQYKKKIEDSVLKWNPKDYKYIFENDFNHYLLKRLIEVLDIENTIKELSNKNTKNNEKIKALDEIKNNFHKLRKEALNIKNDSNQMLISLKENYQKNQEIKYAKETYEKVCIGVIENAIRCYKDFKNKIIFINDEIKSFNN
jgi:hypothetical protein